MMKACEYKHPVKTPDWQEKLFLRYLRGFKNRLQGRLELQLPSGFIYQAGQQQTPAATLRLNNWSALKSLFFGNVSGWAQAYVKGHWNSDDLTALTRWALANETLLSSMTRGSRISTLLDNLYHLRRDNSRSGSRENIAAHYDLGNDFYAPWLDKTMSYSAAMFQHPDEDLEQAQHNKYGRILDLLDAGKDQHVLEIGCGWGGFAEQASCEHQLRIHGITLSKEQLSWARNRIANAGKQDDVHLSLTDYRDLHEQYDGIVSIEMFEAVGEKHWDEYFRVLRRSLKPGGKAVLQVITIDDQRFHSYRKQADFIQRYIFPGGMLPSREALHSTFAKHGFTLHHEEFFGMDYARTLNLWRNSFEQQWPAIIRHGFDDEFRRLWRYYLTYCEGGFLSRSIDVGLFVITPEDTGTAASR
ncbi:SAM-dependent methyltransferase [Aliamphritea hakodatensis]|uniref:SAM-dependent methyltransferase n=1 Tax=Aliamphritea hakodatensis TaxID=2895352 RepID=UPI0022FD9435|nr:cyclopropane-fatty-acyl-phospholipid synthase family protein [Aliamphritea hakodatensis]